MLIDWYLVRLPSERLHPAKKKKGNRYRYRPANNIGSSENSVELGERGVWGGETGGNKGGETVVWLLKNNNNKVIIDMKKEKEKDSSVHLQMTYKRNSDP